MHLLLTFDNNHWDRDANWEVTKILAISVVWGNPERHRSSE
jgi:hypothetical protein